MEKLYVLAGKARSGKDSAASIISHEYKDKRVLKYSCTMYLKKYIRQVYGWNGEENTKPRDLLQDFGREIKEQYPDFFIRRMEEDIRFLASYCDIMIVTGVRLEKELTFLKEKFDAKLIKIQKKVLDNNLTLKQRNDITETDVDNYNSFDYVISNDGTVEELLEKVSSMLEVER